MADITMCKGINCDKRLTCYRYLANANPYAQSYFSETPINDNKCDMYWNNTSSISVAKVDNTCDINYTHSVTNYTQLKRKAPERVHAKK